MGGHSDSQLVRVKDEMVRLTS